MYSKPRGPTDLTDPRDHREFRGRTDLTDPRGSRYSIERKRNMKTPRGALVTNVMT